MKNIFSQLGTKKVAGIVLVGATLMVGLGVVNNFSGGSQKAANEAALARFTSGTSNTFTSGSSASRADLERQMSATQSGYSARFLKGKADGTEAAEAFSSDGAYAEGIRSADGSVYGQGAENGFYQPFTSTYEQVEGGNEEDLTSQGSGYGEGQFRDVEAAAAAASKGLKGKNAKNGKSAGNQAGQIRPATQINKMGASNGGSSFGSGGTGGSAGGGARSFGAGDSVGGGDNNTRALPQNNIKTPDMEAFKLGRSGGMGGFNNVGPNGRDYRGGQSQGNGAASDLQLAVAYSGKAVISNKSTEEKSLAEAAFDGSNPDDMTPSVEEGASVNRVASSLMGGLKVDLPDLKDTLDLEPELQDTAQKAAELAALQKKLTGLQWATVIGALVLSIAIGIVKNIPVYGWFIAAVISVLAAGLLFFMGVKMYDIIAEMQDQKFKAVNQGIDIIGKQWAVGKTLVMSGLLVAAGWTNMWQNIWNGITELFSGGASAAAGGAAAEGAAQASTTAASTAGKISGSGIFKKAAIQALFSNLFPKSGN